MDLVASKPSSMKSILSKLCRTLENQWILWRVRTGRCHWTFLPSEITYIWDFQKFSFGFWHTEQTLPDYHIPSDKLYIVSKYDSGQSFVTISVARPDAFCSAEERVCPLRFCFMSQVFVELPFSFGSNFWGSWLGFATSVGFLQVVACTKWCTLTRMMLISLHPVCQIVDWYCLFALLYISMDILLMYHWIGCL